MNQAVKQFLAAQVIEVSPTQDRRYLSTLFTIQEKTKVRPILDCRRINTFIQTQHFKMEGVPALRELVEENDLMVKIDLKDAYTVCPIHPGWRKYFSFEHRGIVYSYKTLPFGASMSPRAYSKLLRFAVEPLRKIYGIRFVYYLDDICVLAKTAAEMKKHTSLFLKQLMELGFLINWKKTDLSPKTTQEFLGFQFDTSAMTIKVPKDKMVRLASRVKQATTKTFSCRWVAGLLGKITAMLPAIGDALLHIRHVQRALTASLRSHGNNWEAPCILGVKAHEDLRWWAQVAETRNGLPLHKPTEEEPHLIVYVDSSDSGWGVASKFGEFSGFWTRQEREDSINVRELKTILIALEIHAKQYKDGRLLVYTDNTTALKYASKAGGTATETLQGLALDIQDICLAWGLQVQYRHIPGVQNTVADRLSRQQEPIHEWKLPPSMFKKLNQRWGPLIIDGFAARHNNRLPVYWSIQMDGKAQATDAFLQRWPTRGLYLHPPWKLIPRVIQKFKQDRVQEAVLVTPFWPTQFWWPMVMRHSRHRPLVLPISKRFQLTAWKLSGGQGDKGAYQRR